MSANIQEEVKRLKESIDGAKTNIATLDGRETEILKQLKKEHHLSSKEEVEEKLKELKKKESLLDKQIQNDFNSLKEKYDW